jgi:hypothetical protein
VLLLGTALRFHGLVQDARFHSDEAFYATFARSAAVHGDWMLPGPLDKPPLSIYAVAFSMHFTAAYVTDQNIIDVALRKGEFAARLPNVYAGTILIALVYALARRLYSSSMQSIGAVRGLARVSERPPLLAALLVACSPFLIAFSASAFTDTLMLLFMVAALLAVVHGRPGWGGFWLALSVASKPQGIFYLPLVTGLIWTFHRSSGGRDPARPYRDMVQRTTALVRCLVTLGVGIIILLLWDAARPDTSVFALAAVHSNPGRIFTMPDEWLPRLRVWLNHAGWILGPPWFTTGIIAVSLIVSLHRSIGAVSRVASEIARDRERDHASPLQSPRSQMRQDVGAAREPPLQNTSKYLTHLLWAYIIGYSLLHWLVAFDMYDRYLLPIVPLVMILVAQAVAYGRVEIQDSEWSIGRPYRLMWIIWGLVLLGVLIPTSYRAAERQSDVGRNGYQPRDFITLADYLNAKPLGTIIYDRWFGYELSYYLGAWTDKRKVYYPTPELLAEDALLNPDPAPRYFVAPAEQTVTPWLHKLSEVGFTVSRDYATTEFAVYKLIPPWGV